MATETRPRPDGWLASRLTDLTSVTSALTELPAPDVREHVEGVRRYLHEDVLPQAHAEELALFPLLDRLGGRAAARLAVEHDTVRLAAAALDDTASGPMSTARVRQLAGLLHGIELLLRGHLDHEADGLLDIRAGLEAEERARLLSRLGRWPWPVSP